MGHEWGLASSNWVQVTRRGGPPVQWVVQYNVQGRGLGIQAGGLGSLEARLESIDRGV